MDEKLKFRNECIEYFKQWGYDLHIVHGNGGLSYFSLINPGVSDAPMIECCFENKSVTISARPENNILVLIQISSIAFKHPKTAKYIKQVWNAVRLLNKNKAWLI